MVCRTSELLLSWTWVAPRAYRAPPVAPGSLVSLLAMTTLLVHTQRAPLQGLFQKDIFFADDVAALAASATLLRDVFPMILWFGSLRGPTADG